MGARSACDLMSCRPSFGASLVAANRQCDRVGRKPPPPARSSRLDCAAMRQDFSHGSELQFVRPGEDVPSSGWAVRGDNAVFRDGVPIGTSTDWSIAAVGSDAPSWVEYDPIEQSTSQD